MSDKIREALEGMLAIHDEPSGFTGKYGRALDEAIAAQKAKIDQRIAAARDALAQQPAPVPVPSDCALRSRVADLLHLLQFAKIETPSHGDAAQAEVAMNDLERMLAAPAAPVAVGLEPVAWALVDRDGRVRLLHISEAASRSAEARWSEAYSGCSHVPLYATPPAAEQPDSVKVSRELAERLCHRDNYTRQLARRELRNMLLAGGAE